MQLISRATMKCAMTKTLLAMSVLGLMGCSPTAHPMSPTPTNVLPPVVTTPPLPSANTITGTITATTTGQPMSGLTVSGASTDAAGRYTLTVPAAVMTMALDVTGSAIVPRRVFLAASTRTVNLDVIPLGAGFDLNFYRQFVRDGANLRPLQRWTQPPRIYLRTVDAGNRPIDTETLDSVAATIINSTSTWTGGKFGVAGLERGTESRIGVQGWITVVWEDLPGTLCGQSQIAVSGGTIRFDRGGPACRCSGQPGQISVTAVKHELGHAMGFYHTDSRSDMMFDTFNSCQGDLSPREKFHAAIAYSRPVGNLDPDSDPANLLAYSDR